MSSTAQDEELVISTNLALIPEDSLTLAAAMLKIEASSTVCPQDVLATAVEHRVERKFTLFPSLPLELRLLVFSKVEITRRVFSIEIEPGYSFVAKVSCALYDSPALLFTSSESRQTVVDIYKCFSKFPSHQVDLRRDIFVFGHIWEFRNYLAGLSKEMGLGPTIVTMSDVTSKLAHVLVEQTCMIHCDASELRYFACMKGLKSLTLYDGRLRPEEHQPYEGKEAELRQDWRTIWEGQIEPNLFFASDQEIDTMIKGDATWLQVKLNQQIIKKQTLRNK